MIDPINASERKGKQIDQENVHESIKAGNPLLMRHFQLQHHDGDNNRDHAIGKGFEASSGRWLLRHGGYENRSISVAELRPLTPEEFAKAEIRLRNPEVMRHWCMWQVYEAAAKTILTPVSGFLKQAGFTHSLSPSRNCTYGCTYCYVPTMGIYGGLKPEDWKKWGQFTTFKTNASELIARTIQPHQVIYCSPLVDPYQPAERERQLMPAILTAIIHNPPKIFAVQTRSPLILHDIALLQRAAEQTKLRISMSVTTDLEEVRRRYEGRCETIEERLRAIRLLREAGLEVYATLAPLLPCDPRQLAAKALDAACRDLIGDPLHVRLTKRHGATTREPALAIAQRYGEERWFQPDFQAEIVREISAVAEERGYRFTIGPAGFSLLASF